MASSGVLTGGLLSDEQTAEVQAAISDAYDQWVADVEDSVDYEPPEGDDPTEAPAFSELVSASPEQLADLSRRVALAKATVLDRIAS